MVELSTFIAVPACARFFADLGAEVVKIEAASGDAVRWNGTSEGLVYDPYENTTFDLENANKRGITLNLRSAEGREILEKLVSQADVMITNTRERILKKLGFDYESVSRRYPGIVYAHISGYGDLGPEANRPGYDAASHCDGGAIEAEHDGARACRQREHDGRQDGCVEPVNRCEPRDLGVSHGDGDGKRGDDQACHDVARQV